MAAILQPLQNENDDIGTENDSDYYSIEESSEEEEDESSDEDSGWDENFDENCFIDSDNDYFDIE